MTNDGIDRRDFLKTTVGSAAAMAASLSILSAAGAAAGRPGRRRSADRCAGRRGPGRRAAAEGPDPEVRRHRPQPRAHLRPDQRHPARAGRARVVLREGARPGRGVPQAVPLREGRAERGRDPRGRAHQARGQRRHPDERAPLGIRVMQHGKDYMADKPGITTLEQLAEVRRVQAETRRIYSIMYSERLENRATVSGRRAGEGRRDRPRRCRRWASGRTA